MFLRSLPPFLLVLVAVPTAKAEDWQPIPVPEAWKRPAAGQDGFEWQRIAVKLPPAWDGKKLTLLAEAIDDARAFYLNGTPIGRLGELPPNFRSGLGEIGDWPLPAKACRFGDWNVLAIRIHRRDGRTGFNVAAPALVAGEEAIPLAGTWERYGGDLEGGGEKLPAAIQAAAADKIASAAHYDRVQPRAEVERALWAVDGDSGPREPAASLRMLQTADDLKVDLVLSEPHIAQPLSMQWDARGRLWVMEYRQYPNPAGLKPVSRDKYLRTVYDRLPPAPPRHFPGRDRISIHADADGDGSYESHQVFVDGLSLATSFAFDQDGVWVLNPPYLLFYPDRDHNDQPDGPPEVHLQGFGIEDSHSIANSLRWGPDGWLYAAQGSTVTGRIGRPGSEAAPLVSRGQLIWRYHPPTRRYEIFAEGGGNAFGVEMDRRGRLFSGHNGGNTRGFHYVPGGYYQKGFSKHGALSNPYAFGYLSWMKHPPAPRFSHDVVVYDDAVLPRRYQGRLMAIAPLQGEVILSELTPRGSTLETKDLLKPLTSAESWFRPVDIELGPDGCVYVADFYEQRIDHASHYQGRVHRRSGRIYRLRPADGKRLPIQDLTQLSDAALVAELAGPSRVARQHAVRLLAQRQATDHIPELVRQLQLAQDESGLPWFWSLHRLGGLTPERARLGLRHASPDVRAWTVRLIGEQPDLAETLADVLVERATREPAAIVRSQLASTARRLNPEGALPLIAALARRGEDAEDPHVPLLLWWAVDEQLRRDESAVFAWLGQEGLWSAPLFRSTINERLMRRYAATGRQADWNRAADLLKLAPNDTSRQRLLGGFEQQVAGQSLATIPPRLIRAIARAGGLSLPLRLRGGDQDAVSTALKQIAAPQTPAKQRIALLEILAEIRPAAALDALLDLALAEPHPPEPIRVAALEAVSGYDHPRATDRVLAAFPNLSGDLRAAAESMLTSRVPSAAALLARIEKEQLARKELSEGAIRRLRLLGDPAVTARAARLWPKLPGATSAAMEAEIERHLTALASGNGRPYQGRALFRQRCAQCHRLFDEGGQIGPDLTSYQRSDARRLLVSIVNPDAEIREGFENHVVVTDAGRLLTGLIVDRTPRVVVIRDARGQTTTVRAEEIDEIEAQPRSLMPTKLLGGLTPQQVRDLLAYLRATQPLP